MTAPPTIVYVGAFWCIEYEPSSLDIELVFSKSTDTVFDSLNSTEPLLELLRLDTACVCACEGGNKNREDDELRD